ncbi:hypothetical protein D3C78_1138360 [compost metagenome]
MLTRHTQVNLERLTDIHPRRNAERIKHDFYRRTIRHERHILFRHDAGNNPFVTVTSGHFIAFGNFPFLRDVSTNQLINSRRQLIAVLTSKHLHVYNNTVSTMRYAQRRITNLTSLFTEDGMEQSFLSCKLRYALRRHLADQNISSANLGSDTDNSALVKVAKSFFADIWNIACNFFRSKLRVTRLGFILFNMNRRVDIFLHQLLA